MKKKAHLCIIPIVHTYADMGSLKDKISFNAQYEAKTIGLLFIGAAHDVGSLLSDEMQLSTPEMVRSVFPEGLLDFYSLGKERK